MNGPYYYFCFVAVIAIVVVIIVVAATVVSYKLVNASYYKFLFIYFY